MFAPYKLSFRIYALSIQALGLHRQYAACCPSVIYGNTVVAVYMHISTGFYFIITKNSGLPTIERDHKT